MRIVSDDSVAVAGLVKIRPGDLVELGLQDYGISAWYDIETSAPAVWNMFKGPILGMIMSPYVSTKNYDELRYVLVCAKGRVFWITAHQVRKRLVQCA